MAAARVVVVLLLACLMAGCEAQQRKAGERLTHLHFYFHDTVSGNSPTAVQVVRPPSAASLTMFGFVSVMDDPLTEGPEPTSPVVGRAQGLYMSADQVQMGFLQVMNLVLTDGAYNGSVVTVLGRNCPLESLREMPVVGGTGIFRFARGYAQARTHRFDIKTGDAVVEYDVHVLH